MVHFALSSEVWLHAVVDKSKVSDEYDRGAWQIAMGYEDVIECGLAQMRQEVDQVCENTSSCCRRRCCLVCLAVRPSARLAR